MEKMLLLVGIGLFTITATLFSSAAFNGPGNVKEGGKPKRCPKGKRKVKRNGKVRCVPRKQKHKQKQRKAGSSRGRGR